MKSASGVGTDEAIGVSGGAAYRERSPPEDGQRERVRPKVDGFARRHRLSGRQQQILLLIALGMHPKAVASMLASEYSTVRTHIRRMCSKAHCSDMRELIIRMFMQD